MFEIFEIYCLESFHQIFNFYKNNHKIRLFLYRVKVRRVFKKWQLEVKRVRATEKVCYHSSGFAIDSCRVYNVPIFLPEVQLCQTNQIRRKMCTVCDDSYHNSDYILNAYH